MSSAAAAQVQFALLRFDVKFVAPLPTIPLADTHSLVQFVVFINRLRQSVESIREQIGDTDVRWHPKWTAPLQRLVMASLRKNVEDRSRIEDFIYNCFLDVNSKLASGMPGPDAFEYVIAEFAQQFSAIAPVQVPVMLAKFHVEEGTPFKEWLITIKLVVVGSMNMGAFRPGLAVVLGNLKACLSSQYPTILLFFGLALDRSYNSLGEVRAIFDTAKDNMTGAKRATHVSVSPPVPSIQKYSRNSKPRVMSVSANRYLPIMDNAHEVEFDDESEWTRIYSVAQNPTRSKTPRLFKDDYESAESREGRMRVGSACINCAGEDHFLRDCTREYINH